jgi:MarR family transcriptional regulator, organic hydroperoxide resistance regulator
MRIQKFLDSTPLFTLYLAYDQIIGSLQKRLTTEDIHFLQALILTGIYFEERPVQPSELAATLQSTRSNISHSLRSLEKAGWIERKTSLKDARAYFFTLTREGKKKVHRLIKIFDSAQEQIEKSLGGKKLNPNLKLFIEIYKRVKIH